MRKMFGLLAVMLLMGSIAVADSYVLDEAWGERGVLTFSTLMESSEFEYLRGLDLDSSGNLYILSTIRRNPVGSRPTVAVVRKYAANGNSLEWRRSYQIGGNCYVGNIALDALFNIFLSDNNTPAANTRILKRSNAFDSFGELALSNMRSSTRVAPIAISPATGNLFAAQNNQIVEINPTSLTIVTTWPVTISYPSAIDLDRAGNIYLLSGNHIYKYNKTGALVNDWAVGGTGAVDMVVSEDSGEPITVSSNLEVRLLSSDGSSAMTITLPPLGPSSSAIRGRAVALRGGSIYVADDCFGPIQRNGLYSRLIRVQKFRFVVGDSPPPPAEERATTTTLTPKTTTTTKSPNYYQQ